MLTSGTCMTIEQRQPVRVVRLKLTSTFVGKDVEGAALLVADVARLAHRPEAESRNHHLRCAVVDVQCSRSGLLQDCASSASRAANERRTSLVDLRIFRKEVNGQWRAFGPNCTNRICYSVDGLYWQSFNSQLGSGGSHRCTHIGPKISSCNKASSA
jgi:hypothetical protein